MKQDAWIQIVALVILGGLAIFYDPTKAGMEGKLLFFGIILITILFLIIFDIYNKIEQNKLQVSLFKEKFDIKNRIKELEVWKNNVKSVVKNKKGQIDPRLFLLLIIIILIFLYIRSYP